MERSAKPSSIYIEGEPNMPRVTVAIPAYNAAEFLGETLASVRQQTYRDFEIIVVDDGSTDATASLAEAVPGTRVLRRDRGGPAAARNDAVAAGTGELIAVVDADDLWLPTKLARQIDVLDREPEAVLASTGVESIGATSGRGATPLAGEVTAALIADNFITNSTVVMRRTALEQVGGFDTDPGLVSVEDYDLWLRLSLIGLFAVVPEVMVQRRVHEANISADSLPLYTKMIGVIEKFEGVSGARRFAAESARRKAELAYLVGRGHLSRGERIEGRDALRRSRSIGAGGSIRCLALETLSLLPRRWLLRLHDHRDRNRTGPANGPG